MVFPQPPFWFTTAIVRMRRPSCSAAPGLIVIAANGGGLKPYLMAGVRATIGRRFSEAVHAIFLQTSDREEWRCQGCA
jgi:fucose permease